MNSQQKLELLGSQMGLEPAEDADTIAPSTGVINPHTTAPCGHSPAELHQAMDTLTKNGGDPAPALERKKHSLGVTEAVMPGGKRLPMLKTLLTSACERDCYYCPFRARRNFRRATFKPEEMARVFVELHQAGTA